MNETQPVTTLSPLPPTQGGTLEISYTGTPGTTLELDWDPPGTPTTVVIGPNGTASVTVPAKADSLVVSDPTTNGAANQSTVVVSA